MNLRARELCGRHIGQTITFTTGPSNRRTTYSDTLTHIEHRRPKEELTAAAILDDHMVTVIHLAGTTWREPGLFGIPAAGRDLGIEIDSDEEIEVS